MSSPTGTSAGNPVGIRRRAKRLIATGCWGVDLTSRSAIRIADLLVRPCRFPAPAPRHSKWGTYPKAHRAEGCETRAAIAPPRPNADGLGEASNSGCPTKEHTADTRWNQAEQTSMVSSTVNCRKDGLHPGARVPDRQRNATSGTPAASRRTRRPDRTTGQEPASPERTTHAHENPGGQPTETRQAVAHHSPHHPDQPLERSGRQSLLPAEMHRTRQREHQ